MSTSNKLFKPEDFDALEWRTTWDNFQTKAASLANHILSEHLATLTRVYSTGVTKGFSSRRIDGDTHTALLWGITEIEKKECEHVPWDSRHPVCNNCGVKLKAKWEKV